MKTRHRMQAQLSPTLRVPWKKHHFAVSPTKTKPKQTNKNLGKKKAEWKGGQRDSTGINNIKTVQLAFG